MCVEKIGVFDYIKENKFVIYNKELEVSWYDMKVALVVLYQCVLIQQFNYIPLNQIVNSRNVKKKKHRVWLNKK